jgi:hypothetical protein
MSVWIIIDTANRNSIFQIGFETKAAADHYISVNGNPAWKAERMAIYSHTEAQELWSV